MSEYTFSDISLLVGMEHIPEKRAFPASTVVRDSARAEICRLAGSGWSRFRFSASFLSFFVELQAPILLSSEEEVWVGKNRASVDVNSEGGWVVGQCRYQGNKPKKKKRKSDEGVKRMKQRRVCLEAFYKSTHGEE